nr:T9SS type A sorting domain-containing protein [uncultured Psychroserpens sp.]
MGKFIFTFCCIIFGCVNYVKAQTVIDPLWGKFESSSVGGIAEGWGVDVDAEGNVYWPINVNTNNQGLDILCYKFNDLGDSLWANPAFFGGQSTQQAYVCNAKSDFVYIGGRFCAVHGFDCDMQLLKLDKSDGTILWDVEYDFGNNGYDEIDGLEIVDNAIYLGGWGQALEPGPYRNDIGLLKVNIDDGTEIWRNHHGDLDLGEHLDGHFVVDENYIYGCGLWNGDNGSNLYNGYAFLGKFSKTDGSLVDSVLFGNQSNALLDIENALGMATDGVHLYMTGYTTLPGANNWQIFIAKYDKDLNEIWYENWGESGSETARGITVKDGIVYVAGLSQSPEIASQGQADAVLVEYDTDGNFLRYRVWGDTRDNTFRDIVVQGENIYLSGSSGENLLTFGGSSEEAFLIKTVIAANLGLDDNLELNPIDVFPNPVLETITVRIDTNLQGPFTIEVSSVTGATVFTDVIATHQKTLSFNNIASGLYLYTIRDASGNPYIGKMVIK